MTWYNITFEIPNLETYDEKELSRFLAGTKKILDEMFNHIASDKAVETYDELKLLVKKVGE